MNWKSVYAVAVHAGEVPDPLTGAIDTPIYQATTFAHREADQSAELDQALA